MFKSQTIEDYDVAITEFCQDNPKLQIYQVGDISHPGISDLDLIVLDHVPRVCENINSFLCGGNVIVMPSSSFSKINYIEKFNLNLVQGNPIEIENVNSKYFDIIEILEWLPERILLIESVLKNQNVDIRRILLYLKSIDRSIKNVERLTFTHFSRCEISYVRDNFNNYDIQKVCKIYHRAAENAWYTFSASIREIEGFATGTVSISDHYSFSDRFHKLMIYLRMLSQHESKISNSLSERLDLNVRECEIDDDFKRFALERWNILNDIYCWFKINNIQSGMVKYGWLLR